MKRRRLPTWHARLYRPAYITDALSSTSRRLYTSLAPELTKCKCRLAEDDVTDVAISCSGFLFFHTGMINHIASSKSFSRSFQGFLRHIVRLISLYNTPKPHKYPEVCVIVVCCCFCYRNLLLHKPPLIFCRCRPTYYLVCTMVKYTSQPQHYFPCQLINLEQGGKRTT